MANQGVENQTQAAPAPAVAPTPQPAAPPPAASGGDEEHKKLQKRASRQGCCIVFSIVLILVIIPVIYFVKNPTVISELLNDPSNEAAKEKEPAAAREYQLSVPSAEAQNRVFDCSEVKEDEHFSRGNLLCQNLYQTSAEDLKQKLNSGRYDTVMLYGERLIIESDLKFYNGNSIPAEDLYNVARFNDGLTMPEMLKLFRIDDMSFINRLKLPTGKKLFSYDAMFIRVGNSQKVAEACSSVASGCSSGWYWLTLPDEIYKPRHSYTLDHYRNYETDKLSQKFNWPSNCYTDGIILHEITHALGYSSRTSRTWGEGGVLPVYFNEYMAGFVEDMGAELVCGAGTITAISNASGQPVASNLVEYNSIYPAAELSHDHPKADQTCQLASLSAWTAYLGKGEWTEQFGKFSRKLWQMPGYTTNEEVDRGTLNVITSLDPSAKAYLNNYGCNL
jgi:hypothetical protein